jgi:RNA polymerase sigma-70 factor (ECF subfamily)
VAAADLSEALCAAIDGDPARFAQLWRSLQPPLLRYLRVVSGDAADDLASETWMRVVRELSRFAGDPTAFRVWVFRIARHRCLDYRRQAARRRELPVDTTDEQYDLGVRDVALDVIEHSGTNWALRVIASLPQAEAEAVMLRVVAGLDVTQTAAVLDKGPGAVRVATMRGLRRLSMHPDVKARRAVGAMGFASRVAQPEGV